VCNASVARSVTHVSSNSGEDTVLIYSGHLTTQVKRYAPTVVQVHIDNNNRVET